jgi:hypothetical protein
MEAERFFARTQSTSHRRLARSSRHPADSFADPPVLPARTVVHHARFSHRRTLDRVRHLMIHRNAVATTPIAPEKVLTLHDVFSRTNPARPSGSAHSIRPPTACCPICGRFSRERT